MDTSPSVDDEGTATSSLDAEVERWMERDRLRNLLNRMGRGTPASFRMNEADYGEDHELHQWIGEGQ